MTESTTTLTSNKCDDIETSVRLDSTPHASFQLVSEQVIDALDVALMEYEHTVTGAKHIHISSPKKENVFMVALQTLPRDSSGVAHILEHTVLCGSQKYPVRDPFFMMMRRSLSTFMNAFTSSDWTAYPFATENKQDFDNLLSVYLDAVFFSRIDPLDFAQEGHRLEFAEHDNADSPLEIKGVVYNEMKGALSAPASQLYQKIKRHLFSTTTYHFNSGGEPDEIPRLTYTQLTEFYQTHYHPSNALFCTFGDIPAQQHQASFESLCLKSFQKGRRYTADIEPPQFSPTYIKEAYAAVQVQSEKETHDVVAWAFPVATDSTEELAIHLLSTLLSGNSASPLRKALEQSDLGSPSPLTGLMSVGAQFMFGAGFQACDQADHTQIEALIFETLHQIHEEGFAEEDIQAGLFQLEMSQKHISGQSQPYGLELALDVMTASLYGRPLAEAIDIGPCIENLRQALQNPHYLQDLLKKLFLENNHRVHVLLTPDTDLNAKKDSYQKETLAHYKDSLSPEDKDQLVNLGIQLAERQAAEDDPTILPKLEVTDIPKNIDFPPLSQQTQMEKSSQPSISVFEAKTNGLVFMQAATRLPQLTTKEVQHLNTLHKIWCEVGCANHDYLQIQKNHFANTGYLTASLNMRTGNQDETSISAFSVMRASTLDPRFSSMSQQLREQFQSVRFDETTRLQELLEQQRQRSLQGISGRGHNLALNAANAGYHALAALQMEMSGLPRLADLNKQGQASKQDIEHIAEELQALHTKIISQPSELCIVGDGQQMQGWIEELNSQWAITSKQSPELDSFPLKPKEHQAWLTSAQINFCAMSIPGIGRRHEDCAALEVLSTIMNNNVLHTALREKGGAYGGGVSINSRCQTIDFYSYRDPRISGTFDDYFQSMEWARKASFKRQQLDEAILSIMSSFDKPGSPSGEASLEFSARLHGRNVPERKRYRQAILEVTLDDLARVAQTHFGAQEHTKVVVTNKTAYDNENPEGFTVYEV